MSASSDKNGFIFFSKEGTSQEDREKGRQLIEEYFDTSIEEDIKEVKYLVHYTEFEKGLRKYILLRKIVFPFEWLLTRLFLGKDSAKALSEAHKMLLSSLNRSKQSQ